MTPRRFRGRILSPDPDGYVPRLQLELVLYSCIGSILCKPQWWRKWRRDDNSIASGSVADEWMDEMADAVLKNRFYWMTKKWHCWFEACNEPYRRVLLQWLVGFPRQSSDSFAEDLRVFCEDERTSVAFELLSSEFCWPDSLFYDSLHSYLLPNGRSDPESLQRLQHQLQTCRFLESKRCWKAFKTLDSTSVLCWYFSALKLSRYVKRQANRGTWPNPARLMFRDQAIHNRAIHLIKAAHKGVATKEHFLTLYPDADARPKAVELIWFHVRRAARQVDNIRRCVRVTLDDLIDRHDLMNPASANRFISPGPVIETWMSDSIVPADVKAKFVREVAVLEDVPEHEKDWHPGSNNQVLDLVHPSLYCCVLGETKRVPRHNVTPDMEHLSPTERMYRTMFSATELISDDEPKHPGQRRSQRDDYQWIPSDFRVDKDGKVKILSYINNLHPVHHRDMYASIEAIFACFVPLFDRVLSWLAHPHAPEPAFQTPRGDDHVDHGNGVPPFLYKPCRQLPIGRESPTRYSIKGTTVQVIAKMAEIHLTPETPVYPGGSWHIEGTDAEQIVATGIYYFGCKNLTESKLSFRVIVQPPHYEHNDDVGVATNYGLRNLKALVQNVGAATASEDRCLAFPNTFLHKVEPFKLKDPTRPGVRKLLAFFLVDPLKKIPSTSVIAPQQCQWIQDAQRVVLRQLMPLPDVVVDGPLCAMLAGGMSLDTAKTHRTRLMNQRGPFDADEHSDLAFDFCEH
ncbi:hypothetical protein PINS_up005823 [Pythium insidiosum]|nr:hypothetical protein PINS_up005823 [Pythium insidiosum]